ncbi:MAG: ABC-F family ATP-binding cassette domain-containing protein [Lachnospiraceae bacterium]|nr:ABC-F family ATP-binding cassette domain-containing protein [Lachnospiraceae bacterium]MDY5742150.1 ABC-F family ATP-binding cassette domain-containing protein [Lachnospiraceae bacterium]
MIYSVSALSKSFNEESLFRDGSFYIDDKDKVAIVGQNGSGKTTLLRILLGRDTDYQGTVTSGRDKTIGYLAQHQSVNETIDIYQYLYHVRQDILDMEVQLRELELRMKEVSGEALTAVFEQYDRLHTRFEHMNGYAYQSEVTGVIRGLGFSDQDAAKSIGLLSGGEKTRVALGALLLQKPDCIILDEPTNHLDMTSISWLENYLANYNGAVIIVSHDRYFIDQIVDSVIEIDQHEIFHFKGNFTAYREKKKVLMDSRRNAFVKQQQEIAHREAVIAKLKSFNREKSLKRAHSHEKMLDKIDLIERPQDEQPVMKLRFSPAKPSGKDVLHVEGLEKRFDGRTLFHDVAFDIKRGERVALIGDNGSGKTTLLKILTKTLLPDQGFFIYGTGVLSQYYDQEQQRLSDDATVFEEIQNHFPMMTGTAIRNMLAGFLFTGDQVFKLIKTLSGGERGRIALAKLMLSKANFLILDEPTNHLDVGSKEILEEALRDYGGTVLYVSHDRYFINQTATRIFELENEGITEYVGNYDYYIENKKLRTDLEGQPASVLVTTPLSQASDTEQNLSWEEQKKLQADRRKRENALRRLEEQIESREQRIDEINQLFTQEEIFSNSVRCQELHSEQDELQRQLEAALDEWEALAESDQ